MSDSEVLQISTKQENKNHVPQATCSFLFFFLLINCNLKKDTFVKTTCGHILCLCHYLYTASLSLVLLLLASELQHISQAAHFQCTKTPISVYKYKYFYLKKQVWLFSIISSDKEKCCHLQLTISAHLHINLVQKHEL